MTDLIRRSLFLTFSLIGVVYLIYTLQTLSPSKENSAQLIAPVAEQMETTPSPSSIPTERKLTILFGGDMMFDRNIRKVITTYGTDHILQELKPVLASYDLVIANLEGPITSAPSKSLGSAVGSPHNYIFTFDPIVATLLYTHTIHVVNLGNNHILNFGTQGLAQTKQYLQEANVQFFGNAAADTTQERSLILEKNGIRIGFVNYNAFGTDAEARVLADLAAVRPQSDIVLVYTHWGTEYVPTANAGIQELAHTFIDAGADAVIGSHPHVVQQHELYNGRHIYYSLGNFVFDQYFEPAVQQGMLIGLTISNDEIVDAAEIPILLEKNGQTKLR